MNSFYSSERVDVIEKEDSIEFIYKETSSLVNMTYPPQKPHERVYKIVFSCKDGKWNKSEKIYGEIIPPKKEKYKF